MAMYASMDINYYSPPPHVQTVHSCQCPTELCNRNWEEAGSTENPDGPTDSPTEPAVENIKVDRNNLEKRSAKCLFQCYSCDSKDGEGTCDEEHFGTEIDCEKNFGCNIMSGKNFMGDRKEGIYNNNIISDKNLYTRGCSVNTEASCSEEAVGFKFPHLNKINS